MTWKRFTILTGIAIAVIVLLLVGRDQAWWSSDAVDRETEEQPDLPLRTEAADGASATLQGAGDEERVARASRPRRLPAQDGTFQFHYEQGWSFAKQAVVPTKEADIVFKTCAGGLSSVTLKLPEGGIVSAYGIHSHVSDVKTARALYEALVRGHPDDLRLSEEAEGDSRTPAADVFLARTRRGEWLKLAIVGRDTTVPGGWQKWPVTIAYALQPEEPVFLPGQGDIVRSGFELDLLIATARDGAIQADIERERALRRKPVRERLADLDARAARIQEAVRARGAENHQVSGVLARGYAKDLGSESAYRDSTFNFEHMTRDDEDNVTNNDWDFGVGVRQDGLWMRVRTVTDDRSLIADLGPIDIGTALRGEFPSGEGAETVLAIVGHTYLLHTIDSESDYWILMQVLDITSGEDLVFEWARVEDPEPLRHAFGDDERDLQRGHVRIQVLSDHGGGNPRVAFMDGSTNARFDHVAVAPIDLSKPTGPHERISSAYVEGGHVPLGMVFLVESVELTIDIDGGEDPRVDSLVRVGPYPLLWIEDDRWSRGEERGWLLVSVDRGLERVGREDLHLRRRIPVSIPIRREDEKFVSVEGASYTRNDVVLTGRLVAEKDAPAPPAQPGSMHHWQHMLRALLQAEDVEVAASGIPWRAGLLSWFRGLRSLATDAAYAARLDRAIEQLEAKAPR